MSYLKKSIIIVLLFSSYSAVNAVPIYLNDQNISVALGSSMSAEPFANRSTIDSLASIIDASSATASENHDQSTHVWVSGGALELDFDFGLEYDLTMLHFWNYFAEGFDVDNIDFMFFDSTNTSVGSLLNVVPSLGGGGSNPIFAEDYLLSFPSKVQFVNVVLTGTNGQVDFNNIGFTGELSNPITPTNPVPEPSGIALLGLGLVSMCFSRRKFRVN